MASEEFLKLKQILEDSEELTENSETTEIEDFAAAYLTMSPTEDKKLQLKIELHSIDVNFETEEPVQNQTEFDSASLHLVEPVKKALEAFEEALAQNLAAYGMTKVKNITEDGELGSLGAGPTVALGLVTPDVTMDKPKQKPKSKRSA